MHPQPYKTLRFAPGQIPSGLFHDHRLKAGVSAVLEVTVGHLVFVDAEEQRLSLAAGGCVTIAPERPHRLEDADSAGIELRFFRV